MISLRKAARFSLLMGVLLSAVACVMEKPDDGEGEDFRRPGAPIDLPEIIEKGKLTVLAENASTTYFIYKGKKMGFEYELLSLFAEEIGVELEVKVVKNLDSLLVMLDRGEGDIIACNYTVTRERSKLINFSRPIIQSPQVLVQRKPEGWQDMKEEEWKKKMITDPAQLAHKTVQVWKNSSYYERLLHLQEEIGDTILIDGVQGNIGGEELIEMVSDGIIDYTITEANVAKVNEHFFDNLYTDLELSVQQKMAFGLRKSSHLLKARLDAWLDDFKNKSTYKFISRKYFDQPKFAMAAGSSFAALNGTRISQFDAIFKKAGEKSGWDWRLIAAVAYQESKFNPNIQGFGGAYGMMQFMPGTGPKYGVYPDSPPETQIMGGTKKLTLDEKYWSHITDELQRKKFTLATYNAGLGHIMDAVRLAKKHGLNPNVWDDNVEVMLLNLSKQEYYQDEVVRNGMLRSKTTYHYVRSVMGRYLEWAAVYAK
jgi:membrane-bound lytic murein transglycosylase F